MVTGFTLGIIGAVIWFVTQTAEARDRFEENTATAWYCVAITLIIAAFMFVIGALY